MSNHRKKLISALLKGIETGDEDATAVVNPDKFIQHNPQAQEGGEGLAALFKRLSKTSPKVNIVRIFSDGDFVFGQIVNKGGQPAITLREINLSNNDSLSVLIVFGPKEREPIKRLNVGDRMIFKGLLVKVPAFSRPGCLDAAIAPRAG